MQIDRPHISQQTQTDDRSRLRRGFWLAGCLGLVVFASFVVLWLFAQPLLSFGVQPREWVGLSGVVLMPLLHSGWPHLLSNLPPLFMMSLALFWLFPTAAWRVLAAAWLVPPALVWLFAASGVTHVGASGLTFALFGFLALSGLVRMQGPALAISLLTLFYYGGMLSGLVPDTPGISWQAHVAGVLTGLVLAVLFRKTDRPPVRVYDWEFEDDPEPGFAEDQEADASLRMPDAGHRH